MQLRITLDGKGVCIPLQYRRSIHGMIYRLLEEDFEFSKKLHNLPANADGKTLKGFCFGRLNGAYYMVGSQICFDGDIWLEIRSVDPQMVLLLNRALQKRKDVSLSGAQLNIKDVILSDKLIMASQANIRMQSPLVAYRTIDAQGHTWFYTPEEEEFYTLILQNAERKWKLFGDGSPFELQLIRRGTKPAKRVSDTFNGTYITGYICPFTIKSTPSIITMLYQTGLGAGNSMGFGLFDIEE